MGRMTSSPLPAPVWVNRPYALHHMVEDLASCPILAVDTESNSLYVYREQVCLIQFSTPDTDYLVDPLALADLSPLAPIFADPNIEKVFHAAEYDLICLKRDFGFRFTNLFDTMQAARILGREAVGLGSILEAEFGLHVDKRYQRANWGQRPLSLEMLAYARLDTHYLAALRDRLCAGLQEAGRWELAGEDFVRLCKVNGHAPNDEDAACWRVSGAQDLSSQQIAVLFALCQYREECARSANLPPFKVLNNQTLLEIAQAAPFTPEELNKCTRLSPRQFQRHTDGLLKAVQRGLKMSPPRRPSSPRPEEAVLERLELLRSWRRQKGLGWGVDSDVILPKDVLQAIADRNPGSLAELAGAMESLPWRLEHFGPEIIQLLQGGRAV